MIGISVFGVPPGGLFNKIIDINAYEKVKFSSLDWKRMGSGGPCGLQNR
jgi:hypothetical protein